MWRFVKNGLFARDNNQEGAIPVILAPLVFLRVLELGKFLYSTSLNLAFEKPCETDLCVVQHQQRDRIEIGIGECKGDRGHISSEDVENLKATNAKLTAMDLECVLIFAKTADDSYRNEIQLFRQLRDDNIPIVLLTKRQSRTSRTGAKIERGCKGAAQNQFDPQRRKLLNICCTRSS